MVIPESRSCSEMPVAQEIPISERPTLSSIPSAIPVSLAEELEYPPRSDRISQLEERISRLLDENRALLNERKATYEIGQHRIQRANECLQHARDARALIRTYVDACEEVARLSAWPIANPEVSSRQSFQVAEMKANEIYDALVAFISKPL